MNGTGTPTSWGPGTTQEGHSEAVAAAAGHGDRQQRCLVRPDERAVSLMLQSGKRQLSGPSPAHSLDLVAPGPSVRRRSPAPGEFSPVAGAAGAGSLFCSQCGNTEQLGIEES